LHLFPAHVTGNRCLEHFNFETLTPALTAEAGSACAFVAGGALRFAPPGQFHSEIALLPVIGAFDASLPFSSGSRNVFANENALPYTMSHQIRQQRMAGAHVAGLIIAFTLLTYLAHRPSHAPASRLGAVSAFPSLAKFHPPGSVAFRLRPFPFSAPAACFRSGLFGQGWHEI
jgi:hypothetical protein